MVGASADTFAEGIATRVTFDLTFDLMKRYLDDFVLLSEDELADGVRLALRTTHNLAEGAGAAAIAAAVKLREALRGQRIVVGHVGRKSRHCQAQVDRRWTYRIVIGCQRAQLRRQGTCRKPARRLHF